MPSEQAAMARTTRATMNQSDKAAPKSKKSSKDLRQRSAKVAKLGAVSNNQVLTRLVVAYCVS